MLELDERVVGVAVHRCALAIRCTVADAGHHCARQNPLAGAEIMVNVMVGHRCVGSAREVRIDA